MDDNHSKIIARRISQYHQSKKSQHDLAFVVDKTIADNTMVPSSFIDDVAADTSFEAIFPQHEMSNNPSYLPSNNPRRYQREFATFFPGQYLTSVVENTIAVNTIYRVQLLMMLLLILLIRKFFHNMIRPTVLPFPSPPILGGARES
jgi:hypothetical protein